MEEGVTKEDLRQFGQLLLGTIRKMLDAVTATEQENVHPEWLKSRVVRKMLDISPGSLQNLRVTGKVRYKKVLGSYYYNKADLLQLFHDQQKDNGKGGTI